MKTTLQDASLPLKHLSHPKTSPLFILPLKTSSLINLPLLRLLSQQHISSFQDHLSPSPLSLKLYPFPKSLFFKISPSPRIAPQSCSQLIKKLILSLSYTLALTENMTSLSCCCRFFLYITVSQSCSCWLCSGIHHNSALSNIFRIITNYINMFRNANFIMFSYRREHPSSNIFFSVLF